VKKPVRNCKYLLHPSIAVNAKDFKALTAVWPAHSARAALAAVHIGFNGAMVANLDAILIVLGAHYRSGKLMANHAGIRVSRVAPSKRMKIRPTYAYTIDAKQRTALQAGGLLNFAREKSPRSSEHKLAHNVDWFILSIEKKIMR
jgi:hypothetical protein